MELLYIWIEKYKNIEKQGFNFTSKFLFDYNPETNELTVEENPNHIEVFFPEGISNVTAIIGENGSGKSTLLYHILDFLSIDVGKKNEVFGKRIACFLLKNQIAVVTIRQIKIINKTPLTCYHSPNGRTYEDYLISRNPPTAYIFYDNIFSQKAIPYNLIDVSTRSIMKEEKENFNKEEILRQARIARILESIEISDYINFPKTISIFPIGHLSHNYELIEHLEERFKNKDFEDLLIYKICLSSEQDKIEKLERDWKKEPLKSSTLEESFKEIFELIGESENRINQFLDFIIKIKELANQKLITVYANGQGGYLISKYNILQGNIEFADFYNKYKKTVSSNDYLEFMWEGLSSGELAMLSLFGRLYYAYTEKIKDFKQELNFEDNISINHFILLIDEGETGFHPQWQKQYLKILLDFFPQIFPDKNIQIILTSHSPFLASDLPNSNIIFLEKDVAGNCLVKDSLNDMKETFGANIHTLLTDSFFMKKGLMGKYAQSKLQKVIDYINGKPSDDISDDKTAQLYIDILGEPILKRQLQKKLFEKQIQGKVQSDKIEILRKLLEKEENDTN